MAVKIVDDAHEALNKFIEEAKHHELDALELSEGVKKALEGKKSN